MDRIERIHPILEALRSEPGRINKILVVRDDVRGRTGEIVRRARECRVPVFPVPKAKLDRMSPHHQGAVAFLAPKAFASLDDAVEAVSPAFLVLLDGVEDPRNIGAVIRSAECAGAGGVVLPERRSAGLTESAAVTSAGAWEHLPVARVTNLARAMDELRKRGVWLVGCEGGAREPWHAFDYTLPVAIVLGSEGRGLRPLVRTKCDKVLSIPMSGRVDSLNISAAAAVFLFEAVRQRTQKAHLRNTGK